LTSFISSLSISCIPDSPLVAIIEGIWKVFPVRIRCRIASVLIITSTARQRVMPSVCRSKCWQTTALSVWASVERTWSCSPAGKALMIRSTEV